MAFTPGVADQACEGADDALEDTRVSDAAESNHLAMRKRPRLEKDAPESRDDRSISSLDNLVASAIDIVAAIDHAPSPPAIIIDIEPDSNAHDPVMRFPFVSDDFPTPELAARSLADYVKSKVLIEDDMIHLTAWLADVGDRGGQLAPDRYDMFSLHERFWSSLASALKSIANEYHLDHVESQTSDLYLNFISANACLARTLLCVEGRQVELRSGRRDSVSESVFQPYAPKCSHLLSVSTTILSSSFAQNQATTLKHARSVLRCVADDFIHDTTAISALTAFLKIMISSPEHVQDVLIQLEIHLSLLAWLLVNLDTPATSWVEHQQSLYSDAIAIFLKLNQDLPSILRFGASSVASLKARSPILDHLQSILSLLLYKPDEERLQGGGLKAEDLIVLTTGARNVTNSEDSKTLSEVRCKLASGSPETLALAWRFCLALRLINFDEPTMLRSGIDVLTWTVNRVEREFGNVEHSPAMRLLFSFLALNHLCHSIFQPSSPALLIEKCKPAIRLLVQTKNFGPTEIGMIWNLMMSSPNLAVRHSCLTTICQLAAKELQSRQIVHILRLFTEMDVTSIWSPSLHLVKLCISHLVGVGEGRQLANLQVGLASILQKLIRHIYRDPVQAAHQDIGALPLQTFAMIVETSSRDADVEVFVKDCLEDMENAMPADLGSNRILSTLLSTKSPKLIKLALLQPIEAAAAQALSAFYSDHAGSVSTKTEIVHAALVDFILQCIHFSDHEQSQHLHAEIWSLVVGGRAINARFRFNGLRMVLQYAKSSKNVAMWLIGCVVTYLPTMDVRHVTHAFLDLVDFVFSILTDQDLHLAQDFARTICSFTLSIPDESLGENLANRLLDKIFAAEAVSLQFSDLKMVQKAVAEVLVAAAISHNGRAVYMLDNIISRSIDLRTKTIKEESMKQLERCYTAHRTKSIKFDVEIHVPNRPVQVERWVIHRKTRVSNLKSLLMSHLESPGVRAYWMGMELFSRCNPSMELASLIQSNAGNILLVRAIDENGTPQANKEIPLPDAVIEQAIWDGYLSLHDLLDDDGSFCNSVAYVLSRVQRPDEEKSRLLADPYRNLDPQYPQTSARILYAVKNLGNELRQRWRQNCRDPPAAAKAVQALIKIICEQGSDLNILGEALKTLVLHLKEFMDDNTRSNFFQPHERFVTAFIGHLESLVSPSNLAFLDSPRMLSTRSHCTLSLCETLLEAAAASEEVFVHLTTDRLCHNWLSDFLLQENIVATNLIAQSLPKVCGSLSDAGMEARINGSLESVYSQQYLSRALKVKTWVCRNALNALLHHLEEGRIIMKLLDVACISLENTLIRSSLRDVDFLALFDKLMEHLTRLQRYNRSGCPDFEIEVSNTCSRLCRYVIAAGDSTHQTAVPLQIHSASLDTLHSFLFERSSTGSLSLQYTTPLLNEASRKSVYLLLQALVSSRHTALGPVQSLNAVIDSVHLAESFQFRGRGATLRKGHEPIGLINLSQTCYLNALVQQLFGNLEFRQFIMSVPHIATAKQTVVSALQETFAFLGQSCRAVFNPSSLCKALNIDVESQEDAGLFFGDLLANLELGMPDDEHKKRLLSFFQGRDKSQTVAECGHVSVKSDIFLSLSLPVKGIQNLHESLAAYVEGLELDESDAFRCERCNHEGKPFLVHAHRRTCLDHVPKDLVITLKRFEYDSRNGCSKINEPFSFPASINMAPYKFDYMVTGKEPASPDIFELVGVIVHKGDLSYGHYWSYVKYGSDRDPKAVKWYRIEDTLSEEVSLDHVLYECRGTPRTSPEGINFERRDSAFVLFYRRIEFTKTNNSIEATLDEHAKHMQSESIKEDNEKAITVCQFFDEGLYQYIEHYLNLGPDDCGCESCGYAYEENAILLSLKYLFKVVRFDVRDRIVRQLCASISAILKRKPQLALSIVPVMLEKDNASKLLFSFLGESRNAMGTMMLSMMQVARDADPTSYGIASSIKSEPPRGLVHQFKQVLETLVEDLPRNCHAWDTFFQFLQRFAKSGPTEKYIIATSALVDVSLGYICLYGCESAPERRTDFSSLLEIHNDDINWEAVVRFVAQMLEYPIRLSGRGNKDRGNHVSAELYASPEQMKLLTTQRPAGLSHIIENICLCSNANDQRYPSARSSSRFIIALIMNSEDDAHRNLFVTSLSTFISKLSRPGNYHHFTTPALALCQLEEFPSKFKHVLLDSVLQRAWNDEAVAVLSIEFVAESISHIPPYPQTEAIFNLIERMLFSGRISVQAAAVYLLRNHVFQSPSDTIVSLGDQLKISEVIAAFMEMLVPRILQSLDARLVAYRHAIVAFLLGLEALTRRHGPLISFKNQPQLERLLKKNGCNSQSDIDRAAHMQFKIRQFVGFAEEFKTRATDLKLDIESLMEESDDEETSPTSDEEAAAESDEETETTNDSGNEMEHEEAEGIEMTEPAADTDESEETEETTEEAEETEESDEADDQ